MSGGYAALDQWNMMKMVMKMGYAVAIVYVLISTSPCCQRLLQQAQQMGQTRPHVPSRPTQALHPMPFPSLLGGLPLPPPCPVLHGDGVVEA